MEGDLIGRACQVVGDIAGGRIQAKAIPRDPVAVPASLPEIDLGTLSKKVDDILVRAILDGAKLPLAGALENESRLFGEVCGTQDMKIGLDNFLKTSLKEPAKFIHA